MVHGIVCVARVRMFIRMKYFLRKVYNLNLPGKHVFPPPLHCDNNILSSRAMNLCKDFSSCANLYLINNDLNARGIFPPSNLLSRISRARAILTLSTGNNKKKNLFQVKDGHGNLCVYKQHLNFSIGCVHLGTIKGRVLCGATWEIANTRNIFHFAWPIFWHRKIYFCYCWYMVESCILYTRFPAGLLQVHSRGFFFFVRIKFRGYIFV